MVRVGIVGAENSHCVNIAKLCNVDKKVDAQVVCVWGEKPEFAQKAAQDGQIPEIVQDWRAMLGKVDGVMMDHRHPRYHAEVATFYVGHGVPCFVDKPFTFTLAEGKKLCKLARRKKVPITSFSVIPLQQSFAQFKTAAAGLGKIVSLTTIGPVDLDSEYGGVFFYGIHQVDAIIDLLGVNVESVQVQRHGNGGVATLFYKDGPVVTMHCVNNKNWTFHWTAVGDTDVLAWKHAGDGAEAGGPYFTGAKTFVEMFRTKREPFSHERMLAPVAVLEALAKSLPKGKRVKVASLAL